LMKKLFEMVKVNCCQLIDINEEESIY
jgi:hypothetical protein